MKKKILFLTGTRADYGKLKPLIKKLNKEKNFLINILVTGMHLHRLYGYTIKEVKKDFPKIKLLKIKNFHFGQSMDQILSQSISRLGSVIKKQNPDLVVIHGDRVESLAVAIFCNLNNILIAHIEGGEVSGTADEAIRHATSKMSHVHFVSNMRAKKLLIRMGESPKDIYVIGSPEVDIMLSKNLPSLEDCKKRYGISFKKYSILIFHPVTTLSMKRMKKETDILFDSIVRSNLNYILLFPNNDNYSKFIFKKINNLKSPKIKKLPSLRFEYFLTLLKNSSFIIGNSSSGIREAPVYGVNTINLGHRQLRRTNNKSIHNLEFSKKKILKTIQSCSKKKASNKNKFDFGKGKSAYSFIKIINNKSFWAKDKQKNFVI